MTAARTRRRPGAPEPGPGGGPETGLEGHDLGRASVRPWADLTPDVAEALRPTLEDLSADVVAAIGAEVPAYARPVEGLFGDNLRLGVGIALTRFLDLCGTEDDPLGEAIEVYQLLGAGELHEGRALTALLAAYRVGARVAWRRWARAASAAGFGAMLTTLAEAVFAYIDELSAASAAGYAWAQSERAGALDVRRAELVELLVEGRPDAAAIAEAARAADWRVPELAAAVLVPQESSHLLDSALGPSVLLLRRRDQPTVGVLPAPGDGRRVGQLRAALRGRSAVLGPAVPVLDVRASLAQATRAAELVAAGMLPAGDPLVAADHCVTLLLHSDPELLASVRDAALAPLLSLPEPKRNRLAETLLAWLRHRGERSRVAQALHLHPQTVRYRVGQLRELYGARLDDPDERFALELALRAGMP